MKTLFKDLYHAFWEIENPCPHYLCPKEMNEIEEKTRLKFGEDSNIFSGRQNLEISSM